MLGVACGLGMPTAVDGLWPVNAPLSGKGNALRAGERLAAK